MAIVAVATAAAAAPPGRKADLMLKEDGLEVYRVRDAAPACARVSEKESARARDLLRPGGALENARKNLTGATATKSPGLTVFFDDLERQRIPHSSFFIPDYAGAPTILLDCAVTTSRFLPSSLGHEMVHFDLARAGIPSWFEEGIAQVIETGLGGARPDAATGELALRSKLPLLIDDRRPLADSSTYPLAYLFVKYLTAQFGDEGLLHAMVTADPSAAAGCAQGSPFERMVCRGRSFLTARGLGREQMERFTRAGLLRYFALALTLQHENYPYYQVPDWQGFKSAAPSWKELNSAELRPGEFQRVSAEEFPFAHPPSGLEIYRVFSNAKSYRIVPVVPSEPSAAPPRRGAYDREYVLILKPLP